MLSDRLRRWVFIAGLTAVWIAPATAQTSPAPRMEQRKIADNVFMMENSTGSSNAAFVVTDDGVLVWDADIRTAPQVLAAIRRTTDKKVRYVALSHAAGDHATGVWHYREDKPIVIGTRKQLRDLYMQEGAQFSERKASGKPEDAAYANAANCATFETFEVV